MWFNSLLKAGKPGFLLVVLLFFGLGYLLFFHNLNDRLLWVDEAETAMLAKCINRYGYPKVTLDGNYITLMGRGVDTNEQDIWIWSPWLDEYLAALSFRIFGESTASARMPFAIIGLFTLLYFAVFVSKLTNSRKNTAIALLLLATNVAFVLHTRQCRYYAIILFAQIMLMDGFIRLLKEIRSGKYLIGASVVLIFYSNYILLVPIGLTILGTAAMLPSSRKFIFTQIAIVAPIVLAMVLPWVLYTKPWIQSAGFGTHDYFEKLFVRVSQFNFTVAPLLVFLIPMFSVFFRKDKQLRFDQGRNSWKGLRLFLLIQMITFIVLLPLFHGNFLRYLIVLIPAAALVMTDILTAHIFKPLYQYILIAVIAFSNFLSVAGLSILQYEQKIQLPFFKLLLSNLTPYRNTIEDAVDFFELNAKHGENVFSNHPEFSLMFYTGLKIVDGRFHPNVTLDNLPDWILPLSPSAGSRKEPLEMPPVLNAYYDKIVLTVPNHPVGDTRPDPDLYAFRPAKRTMEFIIYRKKIAEKAKNNLP